MQARRLVIVSGVSGSGKSTALHALEDLGYFCVDNLPTPLISSFVDFLLKIPDEWSTQVFSVRSKGAELRKEPPKDFALLVDCRDARSVRLVLEGIERLRAAKTAVTLLYFESSDEVILRRFQETRRPHPLLVLGDGGKTLLEALYQERSLLAEFRAAATQIIDTSSFSPHQLRHLIVDTVGRKLSLEVALVSFGFKYGLPSDADMVLDCRFLPNPHFVPELRELTGLDERVSSYALENPDGQEFLEHWEKHLRFLLPRYQQEGKKYLTVAIGCTGGHHRSVAVAEALSKRIADAGFKIAIRHRDKERKN
jgi:RNase adapter protein RapZ